MTVKSIKFTAEYRLEDDITVKLVLHRKMKDQ